MFESLPSFSNCMFYILWLEDIWQIHMRVYEVVNSEIFETHKKAAVPRVMEYPAGA